MNKNNQKIIIWSLFDDGARSYYNALKNNDNYYVISIGINDLKEDNYYKIDLSIFNDNCIKQLSKLPPPDIILASPPCESWSIADNQQRGLKDVSKDNNYSILINRNYNWFSEHNKTCHKSLKRNYFLQMKRRILGEITALGCFNIINHFDPKFWVIENPQSSKIWSYLNSNGFYGIENDTYYNNWDPIFPKKPTRFLSNQNLDLSKIHIKSCIQWEKWGGV